MSSMIGPGAIGIDADTAAARGSPRGPARWPVTAAVLPALGLRATDLHRDVVRVPQREENRARYFLDRHRLPDARFSAGGDRKDIRLCLDSEVDMVEPGATLVERLARIVRDLCLAQRSGDVVRALWADLRSAPPSAAQSRPYRHPEWAAAWPLCSSRRCREQASAGSSTPPFTAFSAASHTGTPARRTRSKLRRCRGA